MQSVPYSDLTVPPFSYSSIFLDYVANAKDIRPFFSKHYSDAAHWRSTIEEVTKRSIDRTELVKVLSSQNRTFQCGVRALANIDLLLNDNCVAVVTGQQVGLFTGPMYTLYKTISAISLAESLSTRFPDHSFVPVFWLEGEDHDLDEVSKLGLLSPANEFVGLSLPSNDKTPPRNPGPVGSIAFSDSLEPFLQSIQASLQPTEFTPRVFELLRMAYKPGMTFTRSFVHLMNMLIEDSGLVFIDPSDADLKKLVRPLFERELQETPRTCQMVITRSEELEVNYHAQVKPRPINAFLLHDKGRFPIEPHPDGYALKGTRQHYTRQELASILQEHPERFSPNVVLRPLCQDWLLPTLAYVAGPSEVAYLAQLMPLYGHFGLPQPIVVPRASATLIEEKVERVLTRFSVSPLDLLTKLDDVKSRIAAGISDFKADELFASTTGSIEESINSLRSGILAIDPTLGPVLDSTLAKVNSYVDVLKQKTVAAQKRQHEVFLRQVDKAAIHLAPGGEPQERAMSIVYFMNKFGPEIARWLMGELRHDLYKHQLIRM